MRTFILLSITLTLGCSQAKDGDTAVEIEPSSEVSTEPSGEPSSEPSTEETDMPDPTAMPMVNEICTDASATEDWIEIYNPTAEVVQCCRLDHR